MHSVACTKAGRRGRNFRHTAGKNIIATVERKAEPGTNVILVSPYTGCPPSHQDFSRSRADVAVRTPGGSNYIVDVTFVDASLGPQLANNYTSGLGTEKAFDEKVAQYKYRFPTIVPSQMRIGAFDIRGGMSKGTVAYLQEIIDREHISHPTIPKSEVASRLYQRVSVAIQRSVAYNAMEYRYWRVPVALPGVLLAQAVAGVGGN